MKRFIAFFIIFVSLCTVVQAKTTKFLQVTDVHYTKDNAQSVKDFVADINKNYKDLDFVVFTGDNIDKANPKDLQAFLDIVKPIKFKTYLLVGNHDLMKSHELGKKEYMKIVRRNIGMYHSNKPNYVFKVNSIVFITMNGVKEVIPGPNGYYRKDELLWLDKQLTKYENKKVVILQHFPLFDSRVMGHSLYKKDEYLEVLNKHHNVIAIVSGHYHENKEALVNNVYYITTKNFANNKYYKIIEIDEDGFIFTSLIDKTNGQD